MSPDTKKIPQPLEPALLEGLGGLDRLLDVWQFVRKLLSNHATVRTQESKNVLEGQLRIIAFDLAEDVSHILPRSDYCDLWYGPHTRGYWMNPIEACTLVLSSAGFQRHTLSRLTVLDDKLVYLLRTADAVIARLLASQNHASTNGDTASPPCRVRPVWTIDGRSLAPAAAKILAALPATKWDACASDAGVHPATVRSLSTPLQDAGFIEWRDGQWVRTPAGDHALANHTSLGPREAPTPEEQV